MRSGESVMENPSEIHAGNTEDYKGQKVEGFEVGQGKPPKDSPPYIEVNGQQFIFGNDIDKNKPDFQRVYSRTIDADNITKIEYLVLDAKGVVIKQFKKDMGKTRTLHQPPVLN